MARKTIILIFFYLTTQNGCHDVANANAADLVVGWAWDTGDERRRRGSATAAVVVTPLGDPFHVCPGWLL